LLGDKIRTYLECVVFLANGGVDPCGTVAGFDSELGGARSGISLVRMSTLEVCNERIPYPVIERMHCSYEGAGRDSPQSRTLVDECADVVVTAIIYRETLVKIRTIQRYMGLTRSLPAEVIALSNKSLWTLAKSNSWV